MLREKCSALEADPLIYGERESINSRVGGGTSQQELEWVIGIFSLKFFKTFKFYKILKTSWDIAQCTFVPSCLEAGEEYTMVEFSTLPWRGTRTDSADLKID